jgi:hypothetical protein
MQSEARGSQSTRRFYAVDVGSTLTTRGRKTDFAWAATQPTPVDVVGSYSIESLVSAISEDLQRGISVALGLEAPLFIPVPRQATNLSRGRDGDTNRSCMAPAGGYVAVLGIHQAAWILRELKNVCDSACAFSVSPESWPPSDNGTIFFVWEAFVSGHAHAGSGDRDPHLRDAATAVRFFADNERDLTGKTRICAENPLSLIGAAALWSGWSADLDLLKKATVVLRPEVGYEGEIRSI